MLHPRKPVSLLRYVNSSPEVIRLVVLRYDLFPLSLRNDKELMFDRGMDICHEAARLWWIWFGPLFAGEVGASGSAVCEFRHWRCGSSPAIEGGPLPSRQAQPTRLTT
jgi:putative transposase